jgi:hypothetical protein
MKNILIQISEEIQNILKQIYELNLSMNTDFEKN